MCLCKTASFYTSLFSEWSEQDVVDKYLKPINMEHLAKVFVENKITGAVLIALEVSKDST